jgi:hypothetical protein
MIDTPVLIPTSAAIGNYNIIATATWQYSNMSGWYTASPITANVSIMVSQTLDSLFSIFATALLIGLLVVAVVVVSVALLVIRRRRKRKAGPSMQGPKPN